ncbi:fibroblast growth factor 5-like [Megalops cyprinoides]|uniref:fibroblast growth factor 5-like n=1 Tax=Megalops cyprinoides TaxID=118141 RepID=UPI001864433D|nr:fibroblast growth factor 5-like [Megalops cyprinoides]
MRILQERFVAVTTSDHVSLEDQLAVGSNSGRRTGRLYCRVGIGFHLQIHTDGRVNGSHEPNQLSVLELFAISQGVVGIRGAFSKRFLAMNKRGRLHAIEEFTDDCAFRERFQDSSYNTYASVKHGSPRTGREWFVALNKRGKAKMGSSPRVKSQHASTHFLPRFPLQDRTQWGFTVLDRGREAEAAGPPKVPSLNIKVETGQTLSEPVKYWPKFRFG